MTVDLAPYRDLYPFESHWFDRQGIQMHYLDEGDGPVVVMLHGNPSWSWLYRDVVKALRGSHRCIVPDHVGMGLSDKPGDDKYTYTLASRVADLEALLAHLQITGPVSLIVHDWGGMIGMAWAARHPDQVEKIVAMNTACFRLPAGKDFPFVLRLARDSGIGALLVRGLNAFAEYASRVCVVKPLPEKVRQGFIAPYASWDDRIATVRFVQDIPLAPGDRAWDMVVATEEGLSKLANKPMLLAFGLRDFVFDSHFLAEWQRRFDQAEVHAYEDASHYVLEDKGDVLIPRIKDFLAGVPAPSVDAVS